MDAAKRPTFDSDEDSFIFGSLRCFRPWTGRSCSWMSALNRDRRGPPCLSTGIAGSRSARRLAQGPIGGVFVYAMLAALGMGCATPDFDAKMAANLSERTSAELERPEGTAFEVPESVDLEDGLTEDEAVALALWNAPEFRQELAQLGIARSEWVAAGLLQNPTLQLFFPLDVKQLEFMIAWMLDAIWSRPKRLESARARWERTALELVELGLDRAQQVRDAHITATQLEDQARLSWDRVEILDRRNAIDRERVRGGQVSQAEVAGTQAALIEAKELARGADRRAAAAGRALLRAVGVDAHAEPWRVVSEAPREFEIATVEGWLDSAELSRPAVGAARLGLVEAGARMGFERAQMIRVSAILDANAKGKNGFEIGPGILLEIPIFNRNQAGIVRAESELGRAAWIYKATTIRVSHEVAEAFDQYVFASKALTSWRSQAIAAVVADVEIAAENVERGIAAITDLLDARLRKIAVLEREVDLEAQARRALTLFERGIGRRVDVDAPS